MDARRLILVATLLLAVVMAGCVGSTNEGGGTDDASGAADTLPDSSVNSSIADEVDSTNGSDDGSPFAGLLSDVDRQDLEGEDTDINATELEQRLDVETSADSGETADDGEDGTFAGVGGGDGSTETSAAEQQGDAEDEVSATEDSSDLDDPTVVEVPDAQTATIEFPDGSTTSLRLVGIAPPPTEGEVLHSLYESVQNIKREKACVKQWGDRTLEHVQKDLIGQTVSIQYDDSVSNDNKYIGKQGYLIVDGDNYNKELVKQGYVRVFDEGFSKQLEFTNIEKDARKDGRGLWQCGNSLESDDGDAENGQIVVEEIQSKSPSGNDQENLNEEYVMFKNEGESSIDMSRWSIENGDGRSYNFPDDYELLPGETVTVHSGMGFRFRSSGNHAPHLYWGSLSPVWPNDGGTVILRDASFDTRVQYSFDGPY